MKQNRFLFIPLITLAIAPMFVLATKPSPLLATNTSISTAQKQSLENSNLIAQSSRTRRIRFEPGTDSAVLENSVVRGTRDTYILRANRRQRITVNITSEEDNAVFDIKAPNGRTLSQESTDYTGVLPITGDYRIVVGGTRGNATYTMTVTIN
jgi:hypothetical protein